MFEKYAETRKLHTTLTSFMEQELPQARNDFSGQELEEVLFQNLPHSLPPYSLPILAKGSWYVTLGQKS